MLDFLYDLFRNYWSVTVILTLLFGVVYHYVWRNWSFFSDRNVKYVRGWPILGSTYRTLLGLESGAIAYQQCYEAFPNERFIGIYETFNVPTYLIRDPDLVKQLTIGDFDHFVNHRTVLEQGVDPLLDRSLFFVQDEQWRRLRAATSPNFTGSRMRAMHELIVRYTENFVATLKDIHDNDESHIYNAKVLISQYANDIIASTAFGVELNTLKNPDNEFYKVGTDITNFGFLTSLKFIACLNFPGLMKALRVRLISAESMNFLRNIVTDNIEQRKTKRIARNDFIDLMVKSRDESQTTKDDADDINIGFSAVEETTQPSTKSTMAFSNDDIVAQCVAYFMAGFDTISNAVSFMFHELAVNPDIEMQLYTEIAAVTKELNGQPLTYETLQKLKYLDMVLSESMRRWSTVPVSDRTCTKAYVLENYDGTKVQLQPGDSIIIPVYALQMDEKYFKNAEKFDPERFSDANKSSIHPGTYMPFGIGPRACVASRFGLMILKTLSFYILSEFHIDKCEKTQDPLKLKPSLIAMDAEKGHFIGLRHRKF